MAGRGTTDEDFIADEQLTLGGEDERLPWLESGEEDDEESGVDTGRIVGFAMFAALALAALVVGIWWFGQRSSEPELVADGSTIEAPVGPYKEKPANPGGKTFEGTGNLAPSVGEGKETEGQIAETNAPVPSIDTPRPGETPSPAATKAAPSGGVAVQVGAYNSKDAAEAGWQRLIGQTDKLSGVSHRVVQGQVDNSTVYRLQAIAGSAAAASGLCAALKGDGVDCQVKR